MKHKEKQKIITPNNTSRIPQTLPICSLKHISLPEMSTFKHVCLFINYSYLHIEVYKVHTYSPKIFLHFLSLHAYFNLIFQSLQHKQLFHIGTRLRPLFFAFQFSSKQKKNSDFNVSRENRKIGLQAIRPSHEYIICKP